MRACTPEELGEALRSGADVYDTRPTAMRERSRWPGMRPLPWDAVQRGELPDVPRERPVYLVCDRGRFSELVGLYLEEAGFRDVRHLPGGLGTVVPPADSGEAPADGDAA